MLHVEVVDTTPPVDLVKYIFGRDNPTAMKS